MATLIVLGLTVAASAWLAGRHYERHCRRAVPVEELAAWRERLRANRGAGRRA